MQPEKLDQLPNTPMWAQYSVIKRDQLNALLFYRMGDFYELFLDDAIEASQILGITLTARNKGEEIPVPMCGVPFHSATSYINKLLKAGKRVAICEQTEEASATKGIVKREVVRVVSPGMAYDSDSLESEKNNYFLTILLKDDLSGTYCLTDISTGAFEFSEFRNPDQFRDDLALAQPKEILVSMSMFGTNTWENFIDAVGPEYFLCVTEIPDYYFDANMAATLLQEHFKVLNLEGFGLSSGTDTVRAVGAAFKRIRDTQKLGDLSHLQPPSPRAREGYVLLDESTIDHLDLFPKPGQNPAESVFHHLNKTSTAMGARKLREMFARPLADLDKIEARQNAIAELMKEQLLLRKLKEQFSGIRDLERLISKIGLRSANPRDAKAIQEILARLPGIKDILRTGKSVKITEIEANIDPIESLQSYLQLRLQDEPPATQREGNIFRSGWHSNLDELIALTEDGNKFLLDMEKNEREKTGINSLKIKYNKVFGYFIEVTNSNLANVPSHYIRKQTTAGGERFLTEELKNFEGKILSAQEKRIRLEENLFQELLAQIAAHSATILATARQLALLDALCALATSSLEYGYVAPEMHLDASLEITAGRHPALEHLVGRDKFIANSVRFTAEKERLFLITGPNMAGKSTYMRQVALITLLAHTGSFVPAKRARVGIVDRIATRVGASDRIGRGQSTFMVEMNEMAKILRQSTAKSLLVIDEIGRGTSTYDGLSLAWAILEDIVSRLNCRTLFATHYHELTALEENFSQIHNLCVAVEEKEGKVLFLHEVREGKAPGSYGVEVAKLAGLPLPVIQRAQEILGGLEQTATKHQRGRKAIAMSSKQLNLFGSTDTAPARVPAAVPSHLAQIESQLYAIDLNHCTPMEALIRLKGLKDNLPVAPTHGTN